MDRLDSHGLSNLGAGDRWLEGEDLLQVAQGKKHVQGDVVIVPTQAKQSSDDFIRPEGFEVQLPKPENCAQKDDSGQFEIVLGLEI